jgi:UDP-N-acetylglucosamine--N-acetylmuramyl-(pentapeptide) pyrophosphoryl-undecaprenol N-acetylglucosamine transferase
MKIAFTGAGGGHFYPLIAVAQEIDALVREYNLVRPELYYISNAPYDEEALRECGIKYHHVAAGKVRTYFSLKNGSDFMKTLVGFPSALTLLYTLYPDVIFSKGGYTSVPVLMAARVLGIPVFIHDSDAVPGRANLWAGKFADRIGISYPEAIEYFKHKDRVAYVGNPVRTQLRMSADKSGYEHFNFNPAIPTLLILGGSQGAEAINTVVLETLGDLLPRCQIIHQVGKEKFEEHQAMVELQFKNHPNLDRYKVYPFLNPGELKNAAGAAHLVISRAGSGAIFEIACWKKPAILIPIPEHVSRDQRENAYAYARHGGALVIEQANFTPHVLLSELTRIFGDQDAQAKMRAGAEAFAKPEAARLIAEELLKMILKHES